MAAARHNRVATIVRRTLAHATMGAGMRTGAHTATRVHTASGIPTKTDPNTRVIPITATTNAAFDRNKQSAMQRLWAGDEPAQSFAWS